MTNILGLSAHFHDSACCLLQDGKLVAAAQEESFSRRKHDPALPRRAFRYCLDQGGIAISDVDGVAYYENPRKKLGRQLWMFGPALPRERAVLLRLDAGRPEREIREILGYDGYLHIVDHHHAHAASSFYFSGFPEAAILTVDGVGEWATTTYGWSSGQEIEIFEEVQFPDSLGLLYSTLTSYLGFSVNEGEYKVMGLAPYGKPIYTDEIYTLVEPLAGGQYRLNLQYFDFTSRNSMYSPDLIQLFGRPPRPPGAEIEQFHENLASSLQTVLEKILLEKVFYLYDKVQSENLCMAGGVALNCVANGRILREGPFRRLFVQPAASDAGGALGAAAIAHLHMTGEAPRVGLEHVYLGPAFPTEAILELLESTGLAFQDFRYRERDLLIATVQRLAEGKVVGWFQGRMEFGPRALGARSILADPRDPTMRDRINALVKKREAFRPFAPAVLEAKVQEHFDLDHASPFMLETCQVRSALDLPAITHVDNSARAQTVTARTHPRFAHLLEEFERQTGCPILLNTSFNMKDEPIVCMPVDALLCFVRSGIDTLVIEDFLIDRSALCRSWPNLFSEINNGDDPSVSHRVYTLF
jgi:carbamoyltransferase